jgi:signal transduction histidine kinase
MRRRLLTTYLALTVIVLVALEIPLALTYRSRERSAQLTTLQRDAFVIANDSEETLERDAHAPIQAYVDDYARRTGGRATVMDATGHVVADSGGAARGASGVARWPEVSHALRGATVSGATSGSSGDDSAMFVAAPVSTSGQVIGAVRVAYPTDRLDDKVHRYWFVLGLAGLACLAAAAAIGWFMARWVTRPLVPLRRAAARLGRGDLDARAGVSPGPPEVQDLARTFDHMAAQLEELVGAQQAFVADASHQLRTPLTALRLRLENLEGEVASDEAREDLAAAIRETQRLSRMVDGLLALARADRDGDGGERVRIDLANAIDERLEMWRPIADESGIELSGSEESRAIRCSEDRLAQILDNLMANAIAASPNGGRIEVRTTPSSDGRYVELHVVDEGPGLGPEQRRHAFDRFWRAEPTGAAGRSERDGLGGTGLGLAIVARLASVDGAHSELREADGGGVDAVVSYPA